MKRLILIASIAILFLPYCAAQKSGTATPVSTINAPKPDPSAYKTYDDYVEALVDWKIRRLLPLLHTFQGFDTPMAGSATKSSCSPAIESNIEGDFSGWNSEAIYKLDNGQIWQQASYHYHYHYAYHPKVVIYQSVAGCRMRVAGDDDEGATVVRLK